MAEFIKVADVGLTQTVEEGDYNGLVAVMGHLMAVKDRQTVTDEMFEPLKQTIELLKTYGQEMPEEVHTQLQVRHYYVKVELSLIQKSSKIKCSFTVRIEPCRRNMAENKA